jgi:hypothetical protein
MKVLDVRWFNSNGCVGIVKVLDNYEGVRYYIGIASGNDPIADAKYIANWGALFHKGAGDKIFN